MTSSLEGEGGGLDTPQKWWSHLWTAPNTNKNPLDLKFEPIVENGAWWTQVNTCCRIKWQLSTGDWQLSPHVVPCETWHSTLSTVFYVLRLLHNPCKRLNLTHFQSLSRHTGRTSVCGQHHQYVWQAGNLESLAFTLVHNSLSVSFALLKGKQLVRSISESLMSLPCAIFIDFN